MVDHDLRRLGRLLRKRFADRVGVVWKSSAIAAGTFIGTMAVLALTLVIVRVTQGAVATDATLTPLPATRSLATGTRFG